MFWQNENNLLISWCIQTVAQSIFSKSTPLSICASPVNVMLSFERFFTPHCLEQTFQFPFKITVCHCTDLMLFLIRITVFSQRRKTANSIPGQATWGAEKGIVASFMDKEVSGLLNRVLGRTPNLSHNNSFILEWPIHLHLLVLQCVLQSSRQFCTWFV